METKELTMIEKQNKNDHWIDAIRQKLWTNEETEIDLLEALKNKDLERYDRVHDKWFIFENPFETIKRIVESHKNWEFIQVNFSYEGNNRIPTPECEPDIFTERIIIVEKDWPKSVPSIELEFIIEYFLIVESLWNCCGTAFEIARLKMKHGKLDLYFEVAGHYHS